MKKPLQQCRICDKQMDEWGACRSGQNEDGHFYGIDGDNERAIFTFADEEWDILIERGTYPHITVWHKNGTYSYEGLVGYVNWKDLGSVIQLCKTAQPVYVYCADCHKNLGIYGLHKGHEMGTPSGYGDDYIFCDKCIVMAKRNFSIASTHDGSMISAPECEGSDSRNIPHTCKWSKEERNEAKKAFNHYNRKVERVEKNND